jgi:hypothetical protein
MSEPRPVSIWAAMAFPAMAAGMGWGIREFYYKEPQVGLTTAWLWTAIVPAGILFFVATTMIQQSTPQNTSPRFATTALLVNAWLYFLLNTAFFNFAWPWEKWTTRTPGQLCFSFCLMGLTWLAISTLCCEQSAATL